MGSYNITCSISNLSIGSGENIVFIPLEEYKYNYKIGDGNTSLIHCNCFYSPLTLPIFGCYDECGGIDNIVHDDNVEYIEKYFNCKIENIVNLDNQISAVHSGMFIHRKIYNILINFQIDNNGKKTECINTVKMIKEYNRLQKELIDSEKCFLEMKEMFPEHVADPLDILSNNIINLMIRSHETFSKIYKPMIKEGRFQKEIVDFVNMENAMFAMNKFYFPAMSGPQFGNYYASKALYKESLKIVNREIREDKKYDWNRWKWRLKYKIKKLLKMLN